MSLLEVLSQAEKVLPELLEDEEAWCSLFIDYDPPIVERLWRPFKEYRISLHKIYACSDALFHPHPWACAVKVFKGSYEMGIGYGVEEPPVSTIIRAPEGLVYEMPDPNAWHYVKPVGDYVLTMMMTSKPWNKTKRKGPKEKLLLDSLRPDQKKRLIQEFKALVQ